MFRKIMEFFRLLSYMAFVFRGSNQLENQSEDVITCSDVRNVPIIGPIAVSISNSDESKCHIDFYLSTNFNKEKKLINLTDWMELETSAFNPSYKTIVIVHGYMSHSEKPWVLGLKNKFLETRNFNIIIVDWTEGSHIKNYVTAARKTQVVSRRLFHFLQLMRHQVKKLEKPSMKIKWNNLYFIGHSLGAQISGQTAYLLKQDEFYRVERITGLDPAKPCFVNVTSKLRVDKENADFVDIIHTQAGALKEYFTFGLRESVGHMDFYVNGGIVQPQCINSIFNPPWKTVICSHKLASRYFIESLSIRNDSCSFVGHEWDKSYKGAMDILDDKVNGISSCKKCPEMGINAPNSKMRGDFLVITAVDEPYCEFSKKDYDKVKKVIGKIKH